MGLISFDIQPFAHLEIGLVIIEYQSAFGWGECHFREIDFPIDVVDVETDEGERGGGFFREGDHLIPIFRFAWRSVGLLPTIELAAVERGKIDIEFIVTDV